MSSEIKTYMEKLKGKGNQVSDVVEEIRQTRQEELKTLQIEALIEAEKAKIMESKSKQQPVDKGLGTDFLGHIMQIAQVSPARAKEFLGNLNDEDMAKLSMLSAVGQGANIMSLVPLLKAPGVDMKSIIEIAKLINPTPNQPSMTLKDMAEVFKLGIEASKAQGQPGSMMDGWKEMYGTFVQPFVTTLQENQQKLVEARMATIEAKIPPPLEQQIGYIETMADKLGFSKQGGKTSDWDLKLEDMKQSREIDMEKLRWEQRKYLLEAEKDRDKWSAIQETFAPIFEMNAPEIQDTVRKLGADIGKKINIGQPEQPETQVSTKQITCPKCSQTMQVPDPLPPTVQSIKCPNPECGTLIQAKETQQTSTPPPEEPPGRVKSLRPHYR